MTSERSTFEERAGWAADVRALLSPRRAVPIVAVIAALLLAELVAGYGWRGGAVSLLMCIAFVLFAPAWWCRWFTSSELRGDSRGDNGGLRGDSRGGDGRPKGNRESRGNDGSRGDSRGGDGGPSAPDGPGGLWRSLVYIAGCVVLVGVLGLTLPVAFSARASLLTDAAGWPLTTVLFAVGGWGLGRDIQLARSLLAERRRGDALAREVEHARLLAIRHQLDPHFLFNTLNAIAEWCAQDPQVAEAATLKLAAMLRAMLQALERDQWPLSDELDLIEQLFELHRIRDPAKLSYSLEGARDAIAPIPSLLLLPLAENAMTHGPRAGHQGHVTIRITHNEPNNTLHITIENPGPYKGPREGGRGLDAVRRRLAISYADKAKLHIGAAPKGDTRTLTELHLPFIK